MCLCRARQVSEVEGKLAAEVRSGRKAQELAAALRGDLDAVKSDLASATEALQAERAQSERLR
jgi:hypothetical protein